MNAAIGEARKGNALLTSAGVPPAPTWHHGLQFGDEALVVEVGVYEGVRMVPDATALTRTPIGARSVASFLVSSTTPCFDAV